MDVGILLRYYPAMPNRILVQYTTHQKKTHTFQPSLLYHYLKIILNPIPSPVYTGIDEAGLEVGGVDRQGRWSSRTLGVGGVGDLVICPTSMG